MRDDSYTSVSDSAMQSGIQDLSTAHKSLTGSLDELKGQLNASLNEWDGAARTAYTQVQDDWDKSADKMSEIIAKMTSVLTTIGDGYNTNEKKIQNEWSQG